MNTDSPWLKFLVIPIVCLYSASCNLVSYDPIIDKQISELTLKTETFIAKCDSQRTPYSQAKSFYPEAIGAVKTIRLRSDLDAKNESEGIVLERLGKKYLTLEESHKEGPITSSLAEPIRVSLRSLTQMQIAKKNTIQFGKSTSE